MLSKKYLQSRRLYQVTFSLPIHAAEGADEIRVLGDFNDWDWEKGILMEATASEYRATIELPAGQTFQFRYLIDGRTWENDWEADEYIPSPFDGIYNSVIHLEAPAAQKKATPKATAKKKKAPAAGKTAKSKAADDLKKIEGVGPKIAEIMAAAGIKTFADLAKAKPAKLKAILEKAGNRYQMHDPATWPQQAKLAAKGEWDQLAKLQDELKGGRKK